MAKLEWLNSELMPRLPTIHQKSNLQCRWNRCDTIVFFSNEFNFYDNSFQDCNTPLCPIPFICGRTTRGPQGPSKWWLKKELHWWSARILMEPTNFRLLPSESPQNRNASGMPQMDHLRSRTRVKRMLGWIQKLRSTGLTSVFDQRWSRFTGPIRFCSSGTMPLLTCMSKALRHPSKSSFFLKIWLQCTNQWIRVS